MNVAQQMMSERSRGFISPPGGVSCLRDQGPTRTQEILRILNQGAFFPESRPTETYKQAEDFLEQKDREPTCLEEAENQYTSSDLDPELYTQLEREAVATGSNVFAHTSQDFVAQVIQGIKSYQKDARLYSGDVTFTAQDPQPFAQDETVQRTGQQNKTAPEETTGFTETFA